MCSCGKVVAKKEENQNWRAFKNTLSLTSTRPRNERGRVDTHDHLVTFLSTSISRLNSVDTKRAMDFYCVFQIEQLLHILVLPLLKAHLL